MTWNKETAQKRIRDLKEKFPNTLTESISRQSHRSLSELDRRVEYPNMLKNLGADESRIVDGVHVYANLLDYNDVLLEKGKETEQSHKRLLAFLNLHYATADRVIQNLRAIRVDYHGGRLHAVILEPFDSEHERLLAAIQLCRLLQVVASGAIEKYGESGMGARLRFGIDSGKCVAIGNASVKIEGTGRIEADPLFLGSAANEAAKLAEGHSSEGIFLTPRSWKLLNGTSVENVQSMRAGLKEAAFNFQDVDNFTTIRCDEIMTSWEMDVLTRQFERKGLSDFAFHQHTPPLSSIQFAKLHPSNSIRMNVCSIFADLDGYTSYVDYCVQNNKVREAVRDIQIIRSELGLVLRKDFGGKKVRFIGDCIQGMIASGTSQHINPDDTVRQALLCSGGMRSSFELCQKELPSISNLGLAIGVDFGVIPVSRIGIRGEQSVRVASAKVVSESEGAQKRCGGDETAVGDNAYQNLPSSLKSRFVTERKTKGLTHSNLLTLIGLAYPSIAKGAETNSNFTDKPSTQIEPKTEDMPPFRAHMRQIDNH